MYFSSQFASRMNPPVSSFPCLFKDYLLKLYSFYTSVPQPLTLFHNYQLEQIKELCGGKSLKRVLIKLWKVSCRRNTTAESHIISLLNLLQWNADFLLMSLEENYLDILMNMDFRNFLALQIAMIPSLQFTHGNIIY